jgi:hypothetical protein
MVAIVTIETWLQDRNGRNGELWVLSWKLAANCPVENRRNFGLNTQYSHTQGTKNPIRMYLSRTVCSVRVRELPPSLLPILISSPFHPFTLSPSHPFTLSPSHPFTPSLFPTFLPFHIQAFILSHLRTFTLP